MLTYTEQFTFGTVLGLLIFVGSCAYILVVYVTYKDKKFRKNIASIFLFNLLTIDLANLILVMPFSISSLDGKWNLGSGWKKANAFLGTWFEVGSVLALAIISLDRLMAVMKPFMYIARMTKTKAAILVSFTWCQALVFSLVPIPFNWYIFNHRYMSCTFNSLNRTLSFRVFMVLFMVSNFLLSLLVIVGTYVYIFRIARYHRKSIAEAIIPRLFLTLRQKTANIELTRQKEIRTAGKTLIVIGAFVVCHLPYAIIRIVDVLCRNSLDNVSNNVTIATKWLSFTKSALDPFIYFVLQRRFRKTLVKLFRALLPQNRVGQDKKFLRRPTHVVALESNEDLSQVVPVSRRPTLSTLRTACEGNGDLTHTPVAIVTRFAKGQ